MKLRLKKRKYDLVNVDDVKYKWLNHIRTIKAVFIQISKFYPSHLIMYNKNYSILNMQ